MLLSSFSCLWLVHLALFLGRGAVVIAFASPPALAPRTLPIANASVTSVQDGPFTVTGVFLTYSTSLPSGAYIALRLPIPPDGDDLAPTTLYGPTSFTWTYPDSGAEVHAGSNSLDPHCNQTATGVLPDALVTVASALAILTEGQTLSTELVAPQSTGTPGYDNSIVTSFYTGPTTVSYTTVYDLFPFQDGSEGQDGGYPPGYICGGTCGDCRVFFPEVFVYYWPVSSPNTACLGPTTQPSAITAAAAISSGHLSARNIPVQARGLSGVSGSGGTLVNSNGFTFISPSVYIAFPTIYAADACGVLGSIHTSTTIGFPEGALSTVRFESEGALSYYPFDFADAQCPPSTLNIFETYSILGQTGYNPVISPPAGLTMIDPAWVADCAIPAFQGNDPPFALQPGSVLDPVTTSSGPGATPIPASPSSGIPALPIQTPSPSVFSPQTASAMSKGGVSPSAPPNNPPSDPPSPSASQDPKDPPNSPSATASQPVVLPNPISTNPASAVQVGSQTLTPGGAPVIYSGTTFSLLPSASAIVVNGQTTQLPAPAASRPLPIIIGSQPISTNSASAMLVGSQTLAPGGAPVIYSGTTFSLLPSASAIVINGQTAQLPAPAASQPLPIIIGGQPVTTNSASAVLVGSQTLIPGGPAITVSNIPISLAPGGSYLVQGTSTIPIPKATTAVPGPEVFTFAGTTYTANSATEFVVGGQTLVPGSVITVGGTKISLAATPTDVVVGSSTQGLASLIAGPFKGGARRNGAGGSLWVELVGGCLLGLLGGYIMTW